MAIQYWVGDFFIDISRNQVTQKQQSQTIAPKALAVLTYLAQNQGRVVSYDELFDKVWPDTIVTPNTLQRSIAQLRKVLGEDSKAQSYIKTHAKQGYSLECDVRWQYNAESNNRYESQENGVDETFVNVRDNEVTLTSKPAKGEAINTEKHPTAKPEKSQFILRLIVILFGILILGFVGYQYLTAKQPQQFSIGELRALTSTDNQELASIYSPDGQFVVFHRYSEEFCINNIWAKNTKTQQEFQLTKNLDSYGSHSFSKDGNNLVFVETGGCAQPDTLKKCYKLMSLDFNQALLSPQSPRVLMECKNSKIKTPKWLNNNNVTLLQKFSDRWKLINYSVNENKSQVLYAPENVNIVDYDYSVTNNLIALTSIHVDGHYYIEMLDTEGRILSSNRINYPKEIPKFKLVFPNFTPFENQLIFSTGRQLFTLSYDGQVSNVSLPIDEPMGTPIFHPNGNKMLVIKGHYDSDIVSMPLSHLNKIEITEPEKDKNKQENKFSVIERSVRGEDFAILQPDGELIAYTSRRSGDTQLWVTDGKSSQQLTHFPMDTYIYGIDWGADGKSILVNANSELTQVFLDSKQKFFPLEYPVVQLFQWDSESNSALLLIRIKGILKLGELNLSTFETQIIDDNNVNWALKSENGQLVYTDHLDRFWRPGPAEDRLIEALDGQANSKLQFLIKDNVIYGFNDDFKLWSYSLEEELFEIIGELPKNVDDLTDINQAMVMMTVRVSSRKEVVELILNE